MQISIATFFTYQLQKKYENKIALQENDLKRDGKTFIV